MQVVKDPIGTKGARLSTQISMAGRFLVYLPQESHIGISQRIDDEEERQHLREKLQQLLPPEEKGGFIIRTMAETASDRELAVATSTTCASSGRASRSARTTRRRSRCSTRTST